MLVVWEGSSASFQSAIYRTLRVCILLIPGKNATNVSYAPLQPRAQRLELVVTTVVLDWLLFSLMSSEAALAKMGP